MSFAELFALVKAILFSREVILVTVVIALYVNLVLYVVRYRKKTFRSKKPWRNAIGKQNAPISIDETDAEDEGIEADEGEE